MSKDDKMGYDQRRFVYGEVILFCAIWHVSHEAADYLDAQNGGLVRRRLNVGEEAEN